MRKYCEECGKEVETKVITKRESYDVCGESIEVDAQILVCAECGEEFYCEELDNATLIRAYNEYRRSVDISYFGFDGLNSITVFLMKGTPLT